MRKLTTARRVKRRAGSAMMIATATGTGTGTGTETKTGTETGTGGGTRGDATRGPVTETTIGVAATVTGPLDATQHLAQYLTAHEFCLMRAVSSSGLREGRGAGSGFEALNPVVSTVPETNDEGLVRGPGGGIRDEIPAGTPNGMIGAGETLLDGCQMAVRQRAGI